MNLDFITQLYVPIVMVICLCIGYLLKHWIKDVDNKLIPSILTIIGAITACIAEKNITIDIIASGMLTGLASTGLHQMFKQIINADDVNGKDI